MQLRNGLPRTDPLDVADLRLGQEGLGLITVSTVCARDVASIAHGRADDLEVATARGTLKADKAVRVWGQRDLHLDGVVAAHQNQASARLRRRRTDLVF